MTNVKLESEPCHFALLKQASITELKALGKKLGVTGATKEVLTDRLLSTGAIKAQIKLSVDAKKATAIKKRNTPAKKKAVRKKK